MTLDCNSRYCSIDPRQGTALSLAESFRNVSAVGATPLGISDCLNFGSPERPEGMWQIAESIRGLGEAARAFKIPVVSGNVSLYNETKSKPILPTPTLAVVGLIDDASKAVGAAFKNEGDRILVIGDVRAEELGGSEYLANYAGIERGALPRLDYDREILHAAFVRDLINKGLLVSCHDIGVGGLAVALAESCFGMAEAGGSLVNSTVVNSTVVNGAILETLPGFGAGRADGVLFSESGERYLVSCKAGDEEKIRSLAKRHKVPVSMSGVVGGSKIEVRTIASIDAKSAYSAWRNGLFSLMGNDDALVAA
jgi:phosphoribosylformylglycinamidine synthase